MDFVHYDLKQLDGGAVVEVTLDSAANVRVLDDANFHGYRSGRQYRFYGGYVTQSPYRVRVPHHGHWHLVVDLGGYSGQVRSSVRVLRGGA
jgi:hypothetical protein